MIDSGLKHVIEGLAVTFVVILTMFVAFIIGYCEISGGWF